MTKQKEPESFTVYFQGFIEVEAENADEASNEAYEKLQEIGSQFTITKVDKE